MHSSISNPAFIKKNFPYYSSIAFLFLLALVQVIAINLSLANLTSTFFLVASCFLSLRYFQSLTISLFPNSFIILFGSFSALCALPLLGRTLVGRSLVEDLNAPILTFGMIFIFNSCALLSHWLYSKSSFICEIKNRLRLIISPANALILSSYTAFIMSTLGVVALFVGSNVQGPTGKFISAFSILSNTALAAYFLSLIYSLAVKKKQSLPRITWITPAIFFVISILLGIFFNSRNAFMTPILTAIISIFYIWFALGYRFKLKNLALSVISLFLAFSLLSGISSAILTARSFRADLSPTELFSLTLDYSSQGKKILNRYNSTSPWNEDYYGNEFLNRFSGIAMIDTTLNISNNLTDKEKANYFSFQSIRLISILPEPALRFFGFSTSAKKEVNELSSTDLLFSFYLGRDIRSKLTGSFISDAYLVLGWFSPVVLSALFLMVFPLCDVFVISVIKSAHNYIPSLMGMLLLPRFFLYLQSGTIVDMSVAIVRAMIELLLVSFLASKFAKLKLQRS